MYPVCTSSGGFSSGDVQWPMLNAQLAEHFVACRVVRNCRPKFFLRQSDLVFHAFADEFYKAALSAGARDNTSPQARLEYCPGYYASDVFDLDGYSFEVVYKG